VITRLFARVCASACCNYLSVEPGHAVLLLLLQAGAAEKGVPLYKYIAQLAGNSKLVRRRQRNCIHVSSTTCRASCNQRTEGL
jgi:hypothetical protein